VKAAGGHPYDGPRHIHHFVWHALWCGLGDFDTRYGYEWNDVKGVEYAMPIMKARGFVAVGHPRIKPQPFDGLTLWVYWDRGRKYARTLFETPEYAAVIREKVIHDITRDPGWFLTILAKRAWRILTSATPPSLAMGDGRNVSLPASRLWGFLPIAVGLLSAARAFPQRAPAEDPPVPGAAGGDRAARLLGRGDRLLQRGPPDRVRALPGLGPGGAPAVALSARGL
jgi:hypothetical protein